MYIFCTVRKIHNTVIFFDFSSTFYKTWFNFQVKYECTKFLFFREKNLGRPCLCTLCPTCFWSHEPPLISSIIFSIQQTTSSPTNPILNTNCRQMQKCTRTRNCTCTCTFIDQRTPQSFNPKAISRHKFHQIRNVSVSSRKLSCSRVHHMRSTSVMCTYVSYVAVLSLTWKSPLGIRTVRNQSSKSTPLR